MRQNSSVEMKSHLSNDSIDPRIAPSYCWNPDMTKSWGGGCENMSNPHWRTTEDLNYKFHISIALLLYLPRDNGMRGYSHKKR